MQAAKRSALAVPGDVALCDHRAQAVRPELVLAEGARKKTSLVFELLELQYERSTERCRDELQSST